MGEKQVYSRELKVESGKKKPESMGAVGGDAEGFG
jgi:hypothetical protein